MDNEIHHIQLLVLRMERKINLVIFVFVLVQTEILLCRKIRGELSLTSLCILSQ